MNGVSKNLKPLTNPNAKSIKKLFSSQFSQIIVIRDFQYKVPNTFPDIMKQYIDTSIVQRILTTAPTLVINKGFSMC